MKGTRHLELTTADSARGEEGKGRGGEREFMVLVLVLSVYVPMCCVYACMM